MTLRIISIALACGGLLLAQEAKPAFEAASVKMVPAGRGGRRAGGPGTPDPGRFSAQIPLQGLIAVAFRVQADQVNGPIWLATEWYSVDAVVPPGASPEEFSMMLQNLLLERFRMTVHRETKVIDGYDLSVAKGGSKIKVAAPSTEPMQNQNQFGPEGAISEFARVPMSYFVSELTRRLRQNGPDTGAIVRVVDKTGLTEKYNFSLHYVGPRDDAPGPDLFVAIESQLGLRLEPKKMSLDMIVVDHADRIPVEN
jgi:uncharacterized protein (TIGR03435 family)